MAELPWLWDIDEVAAATRAAPALEKLLARKNRPRWEQIVKEGPELKLYWQHWGLWRTDAHGLTWYRWVVDKPTLQWRLVIPDVYQGEIPWYHRFLQESVSAGSCILIRGQTF